MIYKLLTDEQCHIFDNMPLSRADIIRFVHALGYWEMESGMITNRQAMIEEISGLDTDKLKQLFDVINES